MGQKTCKLLHAEGVRIHAGHPLSTEHDKIREQRATVGVHGRFKRDSLYSGYSSTHQARFARSTFSSKISDVQKPDVGGRKYRFGLQPVVGGVGNL